MRPVSSDVLHLQGLTTPVTKAVQVVQAIMLEFGFLAGLHAVSNFAEATVVTSVSGCIRCWDNNREGDDRAEMSFPHANH